MKPIKKITIKCGDKTVKVSQTIGKMHGLHDGQEVSPETLSEVVQSNATHVLNIVKSQTDVSKI